MSGPMAAGGVWMKATLLFISLVAFGAVKFFRSLVGCHVELLMFVATPVGLRPVCSLGIDHSTTEARGIGDASQGAPPRSLFKLQSKGLTPTMKVNVYAL